MSETPDAEHESNIVSQMAGDEARSEMAQARSRPIRLVLIDDHQIVREAVAILLNSRPELEVVGQAADRTGALKEVAGHRPDVILLEVDLSAGGGLRILSSLQGVMGSAKILIFTGARNPHVYLQAVRDGAAGVVLKQQASGILVRAIKKVHGGEFWLDQTMVRDVLRARTDTTSATEAAGTGTLTPRERDTMALAIDGLRARDIAARLEISQKTARHHLSSIYGKLGVADQLELVIYAQRLGMKASGKE